MTGRQPEASTSSAEQGHRHDGALGQTVFRRYNGRKRAPTESQCRCHLMRHFDHTSKFLAKRLLCQLLQLDSDVEINRPKGDDCQPVTSAYEGTTLSKRMCAA